MVRVIITVLFLKDVNPNLVTVQRIIHPLRVDVVMDMENVHLDNAVVSMVGVVMQMPIVPYPKVVKVNLENVNKNF